MENEQKEQSELRKCNVSKASLIVVALLAGALAAALVSTFLVPQQPTSQELSEDDRIRDFYLTEVAAHVSPHGLRRKMDKGDQSFSLVDLRSDEEYEKEHIIGALNIPAYKDPNTSAYGDVDRIVGSFQKLIDENPSKKIIVYCYSTPCMTGRKIGKMLVGYDIYVHLLGIGWNEWRYDWDMWNHDSETKVPLEDYVVSGSEPGTPILREEKSISPCSLSEDFSC